MWQESNQESWNSRQAPLHLPKILAQMHSARNLIYTIGSRWRRYDTKAWLTHNFNWAVIPGPQNLKCNFCKADILNLFTFFINYNKNIVLLGQGTIKTNVQIYPNMHKYHTTRVFSNWMIKCPAWESSPDPSLTGPMQITVEPR